MPAAAASSTAYWISGLSTMGSSSFGHAFVAGRNRVPSPATGKTAFRTGLRIDCIGFPLVLVVGLATRNARSGGNSSTIRTIRESAAHPCDLLFRPRSDQYGIFYT